MDRVSEPAASAVLGVRDTSLDKTLRKFRETRYPQYAIYLIVCVIFLAALYNAAFILYTRFTLRRPDSTRIIGQDNESGSQSAEHHAHVSLRCLPYALVNTMRIIACRTSVSLGPGAHFTLIEVTICTLHLLVILLFEFVNVRNVSGMLDPQYWANRAAVLAVSQLFLVLALSQKNNIISLLTGISYEKLNVFHRAFSRTVLVLIWVHMWGRVRLGLTGKDSLDFGWVRSGVVANVSLTLIVILGARPLRDLAYEVFLASHIVLSIIFLVAAGIHVTNARQFLPYVWSACIFWALDRALRLVRVLRVRYLASGRGGSRQATISALSSDTVGVSLRVSSSSNSLFRFGWRPGQSAYLSVPSVARRGLGFSTEAHPFTIASIDETIDAPSATSFSGSESAGEKENVLELKFIIRVRDGFTRRLHERAMYGGGACSVPAYLDGPYGDPPAIYGYPNVVLVAGGSGVSFTLPLLLDLVRRSRKGITSTICRNVKFILYVRERVHFEAVSKDLDDIEAHVPASLQVDISVFVTGRNVQPELDVSSSSSSVEKQIEMEGAAGEPSTIMSKKRLGPATSASENEKEGHATEVATKRILNLEYGKPAIADVLKDEISLCTDSVAVCVSGPQSLIDDIRSALRKPSITSPLAILRGGPSISCMLSILACNVKERGKL